MKTHLRGIFLTSEQPERTATFYREVAGLKLEEVRRPNDYIYWKLDEGGLQFTIHDAQKFAAYAFPTRPDSNVTHLYFHIERQSKFLEHLSQLNVTHYLMDEVVVTVIDPDGRKVLFGTA